MKILVTAGPTREPIDPVRYISNHSSGKMGYAIAQAALDSGCETTLISGPVALMPPSGVKVINIGTTEDLRDAVIRELPHHDCLIMAAAPADFRPANVAGQKIKKANAAMNLPLEPTEDILLAVSKIRQPEQFIVGFALETENAIDNGRHKLIDKNLDLILVNSPSPTTAFNSDTNQVALIHKDGKVEEWALMSKSEIAQKLIVLLLKTA